MRRVGLLAGALGAMLLLQGCLVGLATMVAEEEAARLERLEDREGLLLAKDCAGLDGEAATLAAHAGDMIDADQRADILHSVYERKSCPVPPSLG